jgi:hypothetical protein
VEIFFLLERHMDDPPLGRVQNSERKRNAILSNMSGGELSHRMQLGFSSLTKTFGVDNEPVLTIETPSHRLKEDHLERIKHFTIFSES